MCRGILAWDGYLKSPWKTKAQLSDQREAPIAMMRISVRADILYVWEKSAISALPTASQFCFQCETRTWFGCKRATTRASLNYHEPHFRTQCETPIAMGRDCLYGTVTSPELPSHTETQYWIHHETQKVWHHRADIYNNWCLFYWHRNPYIALTQWSPVLGWMKNTETAGAKTGNGTQSRYFSFKSFRPKEQLHRHTTSQFWKQLETPKRLRYHHLPKRRQAR